MARLTGTPLGVWFNKVACITIKNFQNKTLLNFVHAWAKNFLSLVCHFE
jgi:hypothetical protein